MLLQSRLFWAIGTLALFTLPWVVPSAAHAYEDQTGLALAMGYSHNASVPQSPDGPSMGALLDYGFDDIWTLRARVDYAMHPETSQANRSHVYAVHLEALYTIDILAIVPYFGAGLGSHWRQGDHDAQILASAHVVMGLDFLLTREVNFALDLRTGLFTNGANTTQLALILRFLLVD